LETKQPQQWCISHYFTIAGTNNPKVTVAVANTTGIVVTSNTTATTAAVTVTAEVTRAAANTTVTIATAAAAVIVITDNIKRVFTTTCIATAA